MISVDNVSVHFGSKVALNDVSFSVKNGAITSLVGKNGAGKSTVINVLSSYLPRYSGKISKQRLSVMPDADNLYRDMTGYHFLKMMNSIKKNKSMAQTDALLRELGIWDSRETKIKDYSFGMKKKVAFIQAYIGKFDTYIFDEPTSGVDYAAAKVMMARVRTLAEKDKAVLITSHDMQEIEKVSDSIILIANGHINSQGTLAEISEFLADKKLLTFVSLPEDQVKLVALFNKLGYITVIDDQTSKTSVKNAPADATELLQKIIENNITLKGFYEELPSLIDVMDAI
ncbi:ABC transporter ATP-binding protein [Periweissella cryptocerci]|uniref:ABC transporter ATP-binding protein n=1 Tax=Periweissella cryptocerci TaxID=2506420 RepID=A0A4P6YSI6_9LACO|nr:ABC transporter ATP-binding protein [Periweissella cryptocerci]QBO35587.1 ABC transporter ATP-binding protein [Periweissella cryptocerci]